MDSNHDFDVENINEPSVEELTAIDEEEKSEKRTPRKHISGRHYKCDNYCNEIVSIPTLSHGEIIELAKRKDAGDKSAQNAIVEANLRLVVKWAKKYANNEDEQDDLIQVGNLGLIRAAEKYDWSKGFHFSTYATWWIRQSIFRYYADHSRVIRLPVHLHESKRKVESFIAQQLAIHGINPSDDEILEATGISLDTLIQIKELPEIFSLNMPVNSEDESSELETFIEDSSTNLEDIVENSILNREILRLLKETLSDEKQFYVIMRRFGFGGSDPQTLEEIGQTLHVSRERIRQIEQNAIRKLKNNEKLKKCLII